MVTPSPQILVASSERTCHTKCDASHGLSTCETSATTSCFAALKSAAVGGFGVSESSGVRPSAISPRMKLRRATICASAGTCSCEVLQPSSLASRFGSLVHTALAFWTRS
ncbi:MAG: hypothetical protein U0838_15035 [Chloroflexota bacterium]